MSTLNELLAIDSQRIYRVMYACSEFGRFDTKEEAQKHRDDFVKRHSDWFCIENTRVEEISGWLEYGEESIRDYLEAAIQVIRDLEQELEDLKTACRDSAFERDLLD